MNPHDDGQDLRERFARLRRADEALAPDFRRLVGRARGARPRPRSLVPAAVAAGAIAALGLAASQWLGTPRLDPEQMLAEWSAPTDFLLRTPGHELLYASPAFASAIPPLEPNVRQERNRR